MYISQLVVKRRPPLALDGGGESDLVIAILQAESSSNIYCRFPNTLKCCWLYLNFVNFVNLEVSFLWKCKNKTMFIVLASLWSTTTEITTI